MGLEKSFKYLTKKTQKIFDTGQIKLYIKYNNNNYKAIQDLIINKKLNLSFTIIENNKMSIGSNTVHNRAYHYADDNQNISQPREWATEMTGTYSYDSSTNKAISASKPSIKLIAPNM